MSAINSTGKYAVSDERLERIVETFDGGLVSVVCITLSRYQFGKRLNPVESPTQNFVIVVC